MDNLPFTPFFFVLAYIVSNVFALFSILAGIKFPKLARLFFLLLFGWACWANYSMAMDIPWVYQDYADSAIPLYKRFIVGTFEAIVTPMVLVIAACQGLIAISMMLKGRLFKIGCWGGIIFGLAVAPIGSYAAFPATVLMAIALFFLQRKHEDLFIWEHGHEELRKENLVRSNN